MPRPRKSLICLQDTPYYHCVSRCVRRAFLCGEDHFSGKSFEHRRQWVENRLLRLAKVFAIDVCAYAVMSNHTHVVLRIDRDKALSWTTEAVLTRWHLLHKGTQLTRDYMQPQRRAVMSDIQIQSVMATVAVYRQRLYDISWFMRLLNEYIARQANKEDACTGRFWEGRFKSQALLDEAAVMACMAYVDLNPLRAGVATTPKASAFTSIQQRIMAASNNKQPRCLFPFLGNKSNAADGLPFSLYDYLTLIEDTARQLRVGQCEHIDVSHSPITIQTGLQHNKWHTMVQGIETQFSTTVSLSLAARRCHNK